MILTEVDSNDTISGKEDIPLEQHNYAWSTSDVRIGRGRDIDQLVWRGDNSDSDGVAPRQLPRVTAMIDHELVG